MSLLRPPVGSLVPALLVAVIGTFGIACPDDNEEIVDYGDAPGTPLRRLGPAEWNNTVADLLPVATLSRFNFPSEFAIEGFENNADFQASSALLVEAFRESAVAITEQALPQMIPQCKGNPDGQCARVFLAEFLPRAFRRPVTEEELSVYVDFWNAEEQATYFMAAYHLTVQAILQSPEFLFRLEFGTTQGEAGDEVPLSQHEIATRLSYFIWASMPDAELFAAAAAGELNDPAVLEQHARRMLADERARNALTDFHRQWLEVDDVLRIEVDGNLTPFWQRNIRFPMRDAPLLWIEWLIFDGPGSLEGLLTEDSAFVHRDTAGLYDVPSPNEEFERMTTPNRAGILMDPAFLAIRSHPGNASPVLRGRFISERVLCNIIDPPPAGLTIFPPRAADFAGSTTNRERYERTMDSPDCSGCHEPMHGLGFPLEGFDMLGSLQSDDQGSPIDETGEIRNADVEGPISDRMDLVQTLASSDQVRRCYAKQWFRYGWGRLDRFADNAVIDAVDPAFESSGGDIQELLVAFVKTDAFRIRIVRGGE